MSPYPASRTLISGGRVLDIDGDLDHPAVLDLFIKDGRIAAIGSEAAAVAAKHPETQYIDAAGKLIIPGLVNAHYHSHDLMLRGMFEQLPLDAWMIYSGPACYGRPSRDRVELRTTLGAAECLLNGITTVQDMPTIVNADEEHLDAIVAAYERSGLRVVLAPQFSDRAPIDCIPFWRQIDAATDPSLTQGLDPNPLLNLIERRVVAGGFSRLRWALGPSGPQRCSDELLAWTADTARRHDLQIFTHLYEARSQAVLARQSYEGGSLVEHLDRHGLLGPKLTIAHGVWIAPEEIERLGRAGVNLCCNPISNMKLLNGFAPITRYAEAGIPIGLGCDNCSGNDAQNMFQSMKTFALLWGLSARAGESGAAREAFKAATIGGALALGMAGEIGRIYPGYRADLVFINLTHSNYRPLNSALRQLVYAEAGQAVDTVMVDGRVLVEHGKLNAAQHPHHDLHEQSESWRMQLSKEVQDLRDRNAALLAQILEAHESANRIPLPFDRFLARKQ